MQLVINISKEDYQHYINHADIILDASIEIHNRPLLQSILNGEPLPKGHGRLIDANRLWSMYSINRANFDIVVEIQKWIDNTPTIIEADNESEE